MVLRMSGDTKPANGMLAELEALRREVAVLRERLATELPAHSDADELSYRELVQSANTIVLRWDLQGRVTFLNDFGLEFFGYRNDELLGRSVVGTIVPETETSGRDLAQMIAELLQHPDRYVNNENENMRRSGERVWVTWRNRTLHDASGRVRELLSIGIDTTERKRAEEALRDSEQRYRVLFQSTPIALVERDVSVLKAQLDALQARGVTDVEGHLQEHPETLATYLEMVKVTDMNAAAMELFETNDLDALNAFPYVADRARFASFVRNIILDLASGQIASQQGEATIRTLAGRQRDVLAHTTVVPGFETTLARVVTALIDITERKQAEGALRASEERFRFLSEHDNLTGAYNTRYLYQRLDTLLSDDGAPCAVIFTDLDRFKGVVDSYGHLNGSRVIQEVAQVIQSCIREPAFAVAYAGDEFVIVMPGWTKAQALAMAGEIRQRIGARTFLSEVGYAVHLSASFGVAAYPDDASTMQTLLALADQALFTAKAMGRDTILAAGPTLRPEKVASGAQNCVFMPPKS
jgi:diguanylate cyclase (GGDEF)-like protein/PAS domain S-box-containing protein